MNDDRPVIEISLPISVRQVSDKGGLDVKSVIRSLWRRHNLTKVPSSWLDAAEIRLIAQDYDIEIRVVE